MVYPPLGTILEVSQAVAAHVARFIVDEGFARIEPPADLVELISDHAYRPEYAALHRST